MTIVAQFSWDDIADPAFEHPARTAWRQAVAEIAEKAKAKLPECNGRVESAVKIVLAGDVDLLPDGTAKVASQNNVQTVYHVVNGECSCKDYPKAPHNLCKHRLSAAIARRAHELAKARLAQLDHASTRTTQPPAAEQPQVQPQSEAGPTLPEAPASANCHILMEGRQVQVTLRDTDEARLLARLTVLLQRFPVETPAQASTAPQSPVCTWHGAMKESAKAKGTWYCPAKMADGSYCKARHPEKGM